MTASSLFTGGRFAIDPELRGAEFERIIQNLDVHFWKAFWNITEIEVLSVSSGAGESSPACLQMAILSPRHPAKPQPVTTGPLPKDSAYGERLGWEEERGMYPYHPINPSLASLLFPPQSLANMASTTVRVSRLLSLPPEAFEMPLTSDPKLTVTISPPLAHTGPGPVLARLISYDLREGQVSPQPQRMASPVQHPEAPSLPPEGTGS